MEVITIIAAVVVILICIAGLVINLLGMPGTWVVFGAAILYNLIRGWGWISTPLIVILLIIAIAGEIIEYYIGAKAVKKHGASNYGVAGAVIGGIVGAIVGVPVFIIGSLLGLLAGALLGAFLAEMIVKKDAKKAWKAGLGAFKGKVGAILAKELLAVLMFVLILIAIF